MATDPDKLEADAVDEAFHGELGKLFEVLCDEMSAGVPQAHQHYGDKRELLRRARRSALAMIGTQF